MSALDLLIALPVIPAAPILVTWWLPWERWIPWGKLPKAVLGPYVLYLSFAAWHFHLAWWSVLLIVVIGTVLSVMAIVEKVQN